MKNNRVIDETTPLLFLAGPMFLEMLLNILINNVDTLMLSHYSEIAAGLGVAGVFAGTATDEFVRGLIVMRRWKKRKWTGKSIV